MSVMTPEDLRRGRPGQMPMERPELQRQAVIDQLGTSPQPGTPPAGPTATTGAGSSSAFSRGGQVKQLPGMGPDTTNKLVGTGASIAATAAGSFNPVSISTNYLGGKLKPKEEMPTFGGEFGHITDEYSRRFEGAGPGVAGGAVRGAGYGAFAGPIGAGVGAGIGAIVGAATKNATSAFSDFRVEDAADAINKVFQENYGRPATESEINEALVGQGWDPQGGDRWVGEKNLFSVLGNIKGNAAKEKADREALLAQMGTGGAEPSASRATPGAVIEGSASGANPAAAARGGGGGPLEGFGGVMADGRSKLEASDSPKYQVARVLQNYPSTLEGLRQALPELQKLGLGDVAIGGSKGDKLIFSGQTDPRFNGVTTFDVIRAAGNGGEAWVWQGEGGGEGAPQAAQAAPGSSLTTPAASGRTAVNGGFMGDQDALAAIRAELERIMAGQPDRDALMAQLGGA